MSGQRTIDLISEIEDADARLGAALEQCSLFALLGERLGKLPADLQLPLGDTTVVFELERRPDGVPSTDSEWLALKEHFPASCARYAVVGMVTACEAYLQRLLLIALLAHEARKGGGSLRSGTYNKVRNRWLEGLRWQSVYRLPEKILSTVGSDSSGLASLACFRSICALRNCLVHRGGTVGETDISASRLFNVGWVRAILSVDGRDLSSLPVEMVAGQEPTVRFVEEVRSWHPGEYVQLSADDCQYIALSLWFVCDQVADEVEKGMSTLLSPRLNIGQG